MGRHRGSRKPLPTDVRRCHQPRFRKKPLVSAFPERRSLLRQVLHNLPFTGRADAGTEEDDLPSSNLGYSDRVSYNQRPTVRLDNLFKGSGRPQLQEPGSSSAGHRDPSTLCTSRGGCHSSGRGYVPLGGTGNPLRPPGRNPSDRPAVSGCLESRGPGRCL